MALLAVEIVKNAVLQTIQMVVMEIGIYFLATGLTTPPAQDALALDPGCAASYGYYKTIAQLQTFQVTTIVLATFLVIGLKLFLDTLGEVETAELPKWQVWGVRFALTWAVVASAVATVLAAIILHVVMLVKVGMDKDDCLPSALKPVLICVFIIVASAGVMVHALQEWRGTPTADSYAKGHLSGPSAYLPASYAASRTVGVQKPSA